MRRRISRLARLFGLATALATPALAGAADSEEPPTLSVSGLGKVSAVPDIAEVTVGVVTQAEKATDALAANAESMAKLTKALKDRGVAAKDIQTTLFQISPLYTQPPAAERGQPQVEFIARVYAYKVSNTVQVTSRQIPKLGEMLDALVQGGANQIGGISLRVEEPGKLLDEARRRAMADAKRKAEILAGEAGVVLGFPRSISEGGGYIQVPRPMMAARSMMAAPTSIEAGEQDLTVSVSVIYAIKLPK